MNEPSNQLEEKPQSESAPKATKKPKSRAATSALLISIVTLGLSGFLFYMYYQSRELFKPDIVTTVTQFTPVTEQLVNDITDLETRQEAFIDSQNTLRTAIEKIDNELGQDRSQWILSETEQLLIIANHRLQLAHDIDTSLAALKTADQQLKTLAKPKLLPVRKAIADEIALLGALERTDITGVTLQLGSLAKTIDRLPLIISTFQQNTETTSQSNSVETESQETAESKETAGTSEAPTQPAPENKPGIARQAWYDILSLIRIRSNVENYKPLLTPDQSYYLRENLRLMLYGAQLAILAGDTKTYQQNIATAKEWLTQNFDNNSQAVTRLVAELDQLERVEIITELPDISGSLERLRKIIQDQAGS